MNYKASVAFLLELSMHQTWFGFPAAFAHVNKKKIQF